MTDWVEFAGIAVLGTAALFLTTLFALCVVMLWKELFK